MGGRDLFENIFGISTLMLTYTMMEINFNIAPEVSFLIVLLRRDVDDKSIRLI